jgi:hypothetical protein
MVPLRAAIYVLAGPNAEKWQLLCMAYVKACGYELVAVVIDEGDGWASVQQLLDANRVDVVVAPHRADPPADRVPRLEFVEDKQGSAPTPRQRRPRLTRRTGGAAT